MKIKRIHLIISLFLLIEIFLGFYNANYTFRTKQQDLTYRSEDEITCISINPTGTLLGIGGKNGSVTLFKSGISTPLWRYHGNFNILSIKLAAESDYLVVQDINDTISLFSKSPNLHEGKIYPLWERFILACKIGGIYSSGGILPEVYIVASVGGSIHLLSKTGETLWMYHTGSDGVVTTFSKDGEWIAGGDLNGNIYLFKIESAKPRWIFPTGIKITSIAISYKTEYIVVGGETKDGKGHIYLLSVRDGELIYDRQVDRPIRTVYISYDGKNVVADKDDGTAAVIYYDNGKIFENSLNIQKRIQSIMPSVFGSYIVASSPDGEVYFVYLPRPAPLWRFNVQEEGSLLAITQEAESVFVSNSHTIYLLSNTKFSELIPGSRIGWAAVFFLGVGVALVLIVFRDGAINLIKIEKGDYLSSIIGFSMGVAIGLLTSKNMGTAVLICGVGTGLGSLICWRNRSILSFLSGCYLGFFGSGAAGCLLGLIIWFSGDERNIFQLILGNMFSGLEIGVLFGPLGAIIGTFVTGFFIQKFTRPYKNA
jgi:WD40 repeat protein